jgi:hypothetical protein
LNSAFRSLGVLGSHPQHSLKWSEFGEKRSRNAIPTFLIFLVLLRIRKSISERRT